MPLSDAELTQAYCDAVEAWMLEKDLEAKEVLFDQRLALRQEMIDRMLMPGWYSNSRPEPLKLGPNFDDICKLNGTYNDRSSVDLDGCPDIKPVARPSGPRTRSHAASRPELPQGQTKLF